MLSLQEWKWFIESMDLRLNRLNYNTFILEDLAHPNFSFHDDRDQELYMIMMQSLRNLVDYSVHFTVTTKLKSKDSRAVRKMIQKYNERNFVYKKDTVSEFLRLIAYFWYEEMMLTSNMGYDRDAINLRIISTRSATLRRVMETLMNAPTYTRGLSILDTKPNQEPLIVKLNI